MHFSFHLEEVFFNVVFKVEPNYSIVIFFTLTGATKAQMLS